MEPDDVERVTSFGFGTNPIDLDPAHHVRQRLGGETDVPVDLALDDADTHRRVRHHVVDRLLTRPSTGMQTCVDDEAACPHRIGRKHPDAGEITAVEAHLVSESFGVEPPALEVRRDPELDLRWMQLGRLGEPADLEVMSGDRLVVGHRLELVGRPRFAC